MPFNQVVKMSAPLQYTPNFIQKSPGRVLLPVICCLAVLLLGTAQEANSFVLNDPPPSHPLRMASFNIRRFGKTVMSRTDVVAAIVRIVQRYDIVFVMETRDASMESVNKLRTALGEATWNYTASVPVGRSTYKEQYVYWYRPTTVKFLQARLFVDGPDDFEREPYMAQFQYWSQVAGAEVKVTFVGAHLKPADVPKEMEALTKAISSAQQVFSDSQGIVTMGDFNADCNYMNGAERSAATLLNTPSKYISYLGDSEDTTVAHDTNCAYDRLIYTDQGQSKVKVANAKVFDFEKGLGLSSEAAYGVSDHFPVEFTLE